MKLKLITTQEPPPSLSDTELKVFSLLYNQPTKIGPCPMKS